MPFYLKSKKLRTRTGESREILVHPQDASNYGIHAGDRVRLTWDHKEDYAVVNVSTNGMKPGEIGLFEEIWKKKSVMNKGEIIAIHLEGRPDSVVAIGKKLLGKKLQGPLLRQCGCRWVKTGAVVAIKPMVGGIDVYRYVRLSQFDLLNVCQRDMRIQLTKMHDYRTLGCALSYAGNPASVI